MSEQTPYQTIDERLASVETKTDRLIVEVDAGRAETQAAFKDSRMIWRVARAHLVPTESSALFED